MTCPLAFSRAYKLKDHIEQQHNYGEEKKMEPKPIWLRPDLQLWWVKSGTSRLHVLLKGHDEKVIKLCYS